MLSFIRWWKVPYYWVGIKAYDLVAGSKTVKSSYYLSKTEALEIFPMLKKDKLVGAIVYHDGNKINFLFFLFQIRYLKELLIKVNKMMRECV